jgi:hypothetical protein
LDTPRQSGLGIASCITSAVSAGLIFLVFVLLLKSKWPDWERQILTVLFDLCGLSAVALGMGIGALTQKDRSKTSALTGVAISSLTLGGVFLLFLSF